MSGSDPVHADNIEHKVAQMLTPVFHGTRTSIAQRILRDGFAPASVMTQIQSVAADHDLSAEALQRDLEVHKKFAILDPRPHTIFVVGDPVKAGSWADRAPEATWEALWAVYRIRNPHVGWDWNMSDEGHLWVLAQRLADPPAILAANAPLGALRRKGSGSTAADEFREAIEADPSPESLAEAVELFREAPEWLVDPGAITPSGYNVVPSRVDHDLMLFMSGESKEMFIEQLRADYWGEPGGGGSADGPWHPFDEVWTRLSGDRQSELEAMVATSITSRIPAPGSAH